MAEVISADKLSRHNVDKYSFKVLSIGGAKKANLKAFGKKENPPTTQTVEHKAETPNQNDTPTQQSSKSSKDELIESLLKKTDEMSSNFIKLQMKLEAMQEEHKAELEKIKEVSFEEGRLKGIEEANKECKAKYQESLNLFATSISKLDSKANEYNDALEKTKSELTKAAIDIAKEVVSIELSEHSQKIASQLASSLIDQLKDAAKITLKVNPKDYAALSEQFEKLENIKVVADNAVSEGGVIALSDIENIDAEIQNRFEQVKRVVLGE